MATNMLIVGAKVVSPKTLKVSNIGLVDGVLLAYGMDLLAFLMQ